MSDLIPSRAAAERLGVSRPTLQRLVERGVLIPVARGEGIRGAMWFKISDLEAYSRWGATPETVEDPADPSVASRP